MNTRRHRVEHPLSLELDDAETSLAPATRSGDVAKTVASYAPILTYRFRPRRHSGLRQQARSSFHPLGKPHGTPVPRQDAAVGFELTVCGPPSPDDTRSVRLPNVEPQGSRTPGRKAWGSQFSWLMTNAARKGKRVGGRAPMPARVRTGQEAKSPRSGRTPTSPRLRPNSSSRRRSEMCHRDAH